ncbi:MAG TPA: hypothetical protein VK821_04625 [Dehalococcoidia bacterium]|nr:hypothetical protein [Dehalococcoidia bacterium]
MSVIDHPILAPTSEAVHSAKRALALTATLALVVLAILLPVMQSSDETAQGYRINNLQHQRTDLQAQIYKTQSQIAQLGALTRIDGEARNRLGMVPVTHETDIAVSVLMPAIRPLPNAYMPAGNSGSPGNGGSVWQKLLRLLPFS